MDADLGDLLFSLVISYIGALELIFLTRHLYNWSCRESNNDNNPESLKELQEKMRKELADAAEREKLAGAMAMKDGVLYNKDGFRIENATKSHDTEDDNSTTSGRKRTELEAELARQKRIEEETRVQLAAAEAELARQQAAKSKAKAEEEENTRKLLESERQHEAEQRRLEEEEEARRAAVASECEHVARANEEALLWKEREHEVAQHRLEECQITAAIDPEEANASGITRKLLEAERMGDLSHFEDENTEDASDSRFFEERPKHDVIKQRLIDENARKFLDAEQELVTVLKDKMLGNQPTSIDEPIIVKHTISDSLVPPMQTVKTQFGQGGSSTSLSSKTLLFPSLSDDGSSNEPNSSKQSSFSTQPSDEIATTGTEDLTSGKTGKILMQIPQTDERQEPDGEDNGPTSQYNEDYLRSLDGISKHRPLMREDGSGRRRAFKKRRSSGSSNSSRDSRASREEELKMFTSLEEEEMQQLGKAESDFTPIKYNVVNNNATTNNSENSLKVKSHHRRHKRSPVKDMRSVGDDNLRSSLEMLGEETTNPWGEVVPEHYKDTEFWKREKAMSIDEEEIEFERPTSGEELLDENAINIPKASSFEDASHHQNEKVLDVLQKMSKRVSSSATEGEAETEVAQSDSKSTMDKSNLADDTANLQASLSRTSSTSPARSSASPRLRRSPRIDEIDQYEERWMKAEENAGNTTQSMELTIESKQDIPQIEVDPAQDAESWRDEHGLLVEGLSDFYDFTASANPSRSRSTSRNPTPQPKEDSSFAVISKESKDKVSSEGDFKKIENLAASAISSEDLPVKASKQRKLDTAPWRDERGLMVEGLSDFYDFTARINPSRSRSTSRNVSPLPRNDPPKNIAYEHNKNMFNLDLYDDTGNFIGEQLIYANATNIIEEIKQLCDAGLNQTENDASSSYSKNLEIRNCADEPAENSKLKALPMILIDESHGFDDEEVRQVDAKDESTEDMTNFIQTLRAEQCRSRSRTGEQTDGARSRSPSPLPTASNIQHSLESRRKKRIQQNDEILETLLVTNIGDSSVSNRREMEIEIVAEDNDQFLNFTGSNDDTEKMRMEFLVDSLRIEQQRSRSRSRSPLPSADNLDRSLEVRRSKRIQHNDEILHKLKENNSDIDVDREQNLSLPMISVQSFDETSEKQSCLEAFREESEEMSSLVASLRLARSRSHSRSKSPMRLPTAENIQQSIETRRHRLIERNDDLAVEITERAKTPEPARITVEYIYEFVEATEEEALKEVTSDESNNNDVSMTENKLQDEKDMKLQLDLSKSCSSSRSQTPASQVTLDDDDYFDYDDDDEAYFHRMLNLESSENRTLFKKSEEFESMLAFKQKALDTEALHKFKTAAEEVELRLLSPMKIEENELDTENESNESYGAVALGFHDTQDDSNDDERGEEAEAADSLAQLPSREHLQRLRCSPTTPEYERSLSEEVRDVQRIKSEMLKSGFKRSTYVGESLDLGNEYESLRQEASKFQRSRTPSPSIDESIARQAASERRKIQENILNELLANSDSKSEDFSGKHGARPKTDRSQTSVDYQHLSSKEVQDTMRLREMQLSRNFQRSTYVGESLDISENFEHMRQKMAEFRRSRSKSRSPLSEPELSQLTEIDIEVERRANEDRFLDSLQPDNVSFHSFSKHLNTNFLDNERRASDSALIKRLQDPVIQRRDHYSDFYDDIMEPEEYHHYRRYFLNQEQPIEEYPNDDYVCVSQIEVRTLTGTTRTWLREDFYNDGLAPIVRDVESNELAEPEIINEIEEESFEEPNEHLVHINNDDEDTDGSDDERQTVVEVEDEIDTDICDFNERGPADESHHEQSECEEAERSMDHYADREAHDWLREDIHDVDEILAGMQQVNNRLENNADDGDRDLSLSGETDDGVGRHASDSDSYAIDQIYDEAIKNRKQSGIMREFDNILLEMQNNYMDHMEQRVQSKQFKGDSWLLNDSEVRERYALWAKTRELERIEKQKMRENKSNKPLNLLENNGFKRENEMRYLGDAESTARQATRLRTRYGYSPLLQCHKSEQQSENDGVQLPLQYTEIEVDLNYKPKREYNWRKNFSLDDDIRNATNTSRSKENWQIPNEYTSEFNNDEGLTSEYLIDEHNPDQYADMRRYSLGGDSITLYSRSPEREKLLADVQEELNEFEDLSQWNENSQVFDKEPETKSKSKKKSKKKTRRESKLTALQDIHKSLHNNEEDDSDTNQAVQTQNSQRRRRSSSNTIQKQSSLESEAGAKRKSCSRRGSKSSANIDENAVNCMSGNLDDGTFETISCGTATIKKKVIKKRKKVKAESSKSLEMDIKEEDCPNAGYEPESIYPEDSVNRTASANITPEASSFKMLASLSPPGNSVCATPASIESFDSTTTKIDMNSSQDNSSYSVRSTPVDITPETLDNFDILKDGNFYPLF